MKSIFLCILVNCSIIPCTFAKGSDYPFAIGEEVNFKVRYGWFTIGKASMKISSDTINKITPSFNVNVEARTAGLLGFFKHTVNSFDATIRQSDLKPSIATQNFLDNKKRDIQTNFFDYEKGTVKVERVDTEKPKEHRPEFYNIDSATYDMLSAYLYLRNTNVQSIQPKDSIMLKVFFRKKKYQFGMEYAGTEIIKTQIGKLKAHKFYLLFPVSSAFPEARSVIVWATTDENQLPLKIEAQLKFGRVYCDVTDYLNIKVPISKKY